MGGEGDREPRVASRFLTSATFGPTREAVEVLAGKLRSGDEESVLANWVDEQMALPPTSHREYFRRRANARMPGQYSLASTLGSARCGPHLHQERPS